MKKNNMKNKILEEPTIKLSKNDIQTKMRRLELFALFGSLFAFIFALTHFALRDTSGGYWMILFTILFIASYILFSRQKNIRTASVATLLIMTGFYVFMIFNGGVMNTGLLWFYLFPIVAFFATGKRSGVIWFIIFSIVIGGLAVLDSIGVVHLAIGHDRVYVVLASLVLGIIFLYSYEDANEKFQELISKKNQEITKKAQEYLEAVKISTQAQKSLKSNVDEIENKNTLLENTKKAMVNLLEDVDDERKISLSRASDLQKYELAVENASDQIIITDPDGKIIYANLALEKITGYSREDVLGQTPKIWGGQMDDKFYQKMWRTIKNYKTVFSAEIKNHRKNGQEYIADVYISPILDDDKQIKFFVGIERDITKAKEVDQAKTEFVSLASHQLRTPLSAINWYTELMLSGDAGKISAEQKNYLREVYDSSKKMADLVNSLLNVSRIEMGTFIIEPKNLDLVAIAKDVLNEIKIIIDQKRIKVTENYKPSKIIAKIDPNLTRIIFQNLLTNAVKYNKEGGKLTVDISKQKKYFMIKIIDTGYGIPQSSQDKIFTKLFRAENIKQKVTDGTGLGLYIVRSIIQQSGGQIWFNSTENKGTTFYVVIPREGMKQKAGEKTLENVKK